jgi:hypothetical protein
MCQSHNLRKSHYNMGLVGGGGLASTGERPPFFEISSPQRPVYRPKIRSQSPWNRDLCGAAREFGFRDKFAAGLPLRRRQPHPSFLLSARQTRCNVPIHRGIREASASAAARLPDALRDRYHEYACGATRPVSCRSSTAQLLTSSVRYRLNCQS